jgi:anti-sigma-K factor RskA
MTCDELRGYYELHALGVLNEPERSEAEAHLRRACPTCTEEMRLARETNAMIFASVPDVAPPAHLRRRILASVGVEQSRGWLSWIPWAGVAAATACAALLYFALQDTRQSREQAIAQLGQTEAKMGQMGARLAQMQDAVRLMTEPATRHVTFGKGPQGRVLVNPARGVLLLASNLPQLPQGKTYELWIIPKGGAPRPAGLFQSDPNGNAMHFVAGPVDVASTGAVAVSVEPETGSPAPTTTPIIVAPVAD